MPTSSVIKFLEVLRDWIQDPHRLTSSNRNLANNDAITTFTTVSKQNQDNQREGSKHHQEKDL